MIENVEWKFKNAVWRFFFRSSNRGEKNSGSNGSSNVQTTKVWGKETNVVREEKHSVDTKAADLDDNEEGNEFFVGFLLTIK